MGRISFKKKKKKNNVANMHSLAASIIESVSEDENNIIDKSFRKDSC